MRPKEVNSVSEVELVIEGGGGKISCGGAEKHGENSGGSEITLPTGGQSWRVSGSVPYTQCDTVIDTMVTSVRPKELSAGNFGEIFGQFSAETVSPPWVIFGCSVFLLSIAIFAKKSYFG